MPPDIIAERRREPAQAHFRRLDKTPPAPGAKGENIATAPGVGTEPAGGRFEVYRADEVRMTSTLFGGGDWHWRLSDADGLILLDTGGYASEGECLSAIGILRQNAAFARVSRTHR